MQYKSVYPVVDVFAGPGGLGEGFSAFRSSQGRTVFGSLAAIERDAFSHRTLLLRHFVRCFPDNALPPEYYDYLAQRLSLQELYARFPEQYKAASTTALRLSLGPENRAAVRRLIKEKLGFAKKWVLIGGPPCQAYSLAGRSRMRADPHFEEDERHFLYREYLHIIADHAPPVFVMENVKGLLSARVGDELVIHKIIKDLARPRFAFGQRENGLAYRLHSLSEPALLDGATDPRCFLVRAERYGVPQARHRMFIVGVRGDLDIKPQCLHPHAPPTLAQTIGDLPRIRSGISRGRDSTGRWLEEISSILPGLSEQGENGEPAGAAVTEGLRTHLHQLHRSCPGPRSAVTRPEAPHSNHRVLAAMHDARLPVLTGHESRGHMPSDLRRYFFASVFARVTGQSPRLADFPASLLPDHKNIAEGRAGKMFADRFRVQLADQPSTTITSHISKDGHYFIHCDPLQCRSLTVREAARLQTFPDNYKFEGPRTSYLVH